MRSNLHSIVFVRPWILAIFLISLHVASATGWPRSGDSHGPGNHDMDAHGVWHGVLPPGKVVFIVISETDRLLAFRYWWALLTNSSCIQPAIFFRCLGDLVSNFRGSSTPAKGTMGSFKSWWEVDAADLSSSQLRLWDSSGCPQQIQRHRSPDIDCP